MPPKGVYSHISGIDLVQAVVFGRDLTHKQLEDLRTVIRNEPRRFIAQEVIDFLDLPIMEGGEKVLRKADLRAAWPSPGVWPI